MKILMRGMGSAKDFAKLEKSGAAELVGGFQLGMFFDTEWPNPQLGEFLQEASALSSISLNTYMEFKSSEINSARFLRLRNRKATQESDKDYEQMMTDIDALPWLGNDLLGKYRLPNRLTVSRISFKPNQVSGVGEWSAEFIVGTAVRQLFEAAGFSGIQFLPVYRKGSKEEWEQYFQIYSEHVPGTRVLDIASAQIRSSFPEEQVFDVLGCLCYESNTLDQALDFNRTGEAAVGFAYPEWIVSAAVRDCFHENKLRGWAFEPILEIGSDLYGEYVDIWTSFFALLQSCEVHTLRGQKPWTQTPDSH